MKKILLIAVILATLGQVSFASGVMPKKEPVTGASIAPADGVEVFVTSWCPYCNQLESFLKKENIPYTRYDVERDAKGAEIFEKIGGAGVPVARVGNKVIHGYDPERILEALRS